MGTLRRSERPPSSRGESTKSTKHIQEHSARAPRGGALMNALKFYEYAETHGGATINGGELKTYADGYQVATLEGREVQAEHLGTLLLLIDTLQLQNVGLWLDAGIWYMDTDSRHIKDKEEAHALARANNQKAVYNWATGQSEAV